MEEHRGKPWTRRFSWLSSALIGFSPWSPAQPLWIFLCLPFHKGHHPLNFLPWISFPCCHMLIKAVEIMRFIATLVSQVMALSAGNIPAFEVQGSSAHTANGTKKEISEASKTGAIGRQGYRNFPPIILKHANRPVIVDPDVESTRSGFPAPPCPPEGTPSDPWPKKFPFRKVVRVNLVTILNFGLSIAPMVTPWSVSAHFCFT